MSIGLHLHVLTDLSIQIHCTNVALFRGDRPVRKQNSASLNFRDGSTLVVVCKHTSQWYLLTPHYRNTMCLLTDKGYHIVSSKITI